MTLSHAATEIQTRRPSLTVITEAQERPPNPQSKAFGLAPATSFRTRSSNVRTFESCKRQWYLQCVLGYMQVESEAMRFGTKMHLHLEEWLKFGKVPDYSKEGLAAVKSIKLLPEPSKGLAVEHKILEILPDGDERGAATVYTGAIDLCDLRPVSEVKHWPAPTDNYASEPGPLVPYRLYDHKSCASLRWSKTRAELEDDVSSTFYGREIIRRTGDRVVYSRWNYSERVGSKAEPRDFVLTAEGIERRWQRTQQTVAEMRELHYSQKNWTEVTGNYDHCEAYGGCQFRAQCSLQRNQEVAMGLLDHLKAGGEVGKGVAAPGAPAGGALDGTSLGNSLATLFAKSTTPTVQSAPATQPPKVPALVQALRTEVAPPAPDAEPDLMSEGSDVLDANGEGMGAAAAEGVSFGINPPDAAPADLQKDTVEKKTRKKREKKMDEVVVAQESPAVATYLEAVAGPKVEELKTFLSTPQAPRKTAGTLLERIERLEQSTGGSAGGDTRSLEDRLDQLEARIARIEEAVGL